MIRLVVAWLFGVHVALAATGEATIALNFQDVEIPVLAKLVSEVTGRNLIVDDRVRGKVTIISPTRITPDEAWLVFQSVLQVKGFATVSAGSHTKVVPLRDARESGSAGTSDGVGDVVTRVIAVRNADVASLVPVLQPVVSKDGLIVAHPSTNRLVVVDTGANTERVASLVTELDKTTTARSVDTVPLRFASAEELAARLHETLSGADPAALRVVPEPRTNTLLLSGSPADVARARELIFTLDVPQREGAADVHVHRLRHAQADAMVRVLSQLLGLPAPPEPTPRPRGSSFARRAGGRDAQAGGTGYEAELGRPDAPSTPPAVTPVSTGGGSIPLEAPVRVTADPATNALVVSATPGDWATLRRVIDDLDVARRQVFVEAIVLEATVERTRALGIEFQGTTALGGSSVGLGQVNLSQLAGAAADPLSVPGLLLAAASDKTVTLPNGQEVPAYTVLIQALETDTDINILSAPNVVATDNEEAEIVVGRNVPFVASRATSAANLSNLFTTVERHDVGITLRMTPQVIADDFVRLTVFEEVSDIDERGRDVVGDPDVLGPTTTIRSASTVIAAHDGQTVVLGGLLGDAIRTNERGVPFLRDIPGIGNLFRSQSGRRVKTNLLVFLTPHILDTGDDLRERAERQREQMPPAVRRSPALRSPHWEEDAPG